jgi:hypothetical protein
VPAWTAHREGIGIAVSLISYSYDFKFISIKRGTMTYKGGNSLFYRFRLQSYNIISKVVSVAYGKDVNGRK